MESSFISTGLAIKNTAHFNDWVLQINTQEQSLLRKN